MKYAVYGALFVAGLIHLLPLSGVLGSSQLASLYGLRFDEPSLSILMRHRAVLFGLIGSLMLWSIFRPALRSAAFLGGIISVASFILLALTADSYNAQIRRVVLVDAVVLIGLFVGAIAHFSMLSSRQPQLSAREASNT
jgi:hypothetical protein